MPKRNHDGYVFYEHQHYLQKVGTKIFFAYTPELAARDDMVHYNPFATDQTKEVKIGPGEDHASLHNDRTKELSGYSREEIRDAVKSLNRPQRIFWAMDLLFQQLPIHDLISFSPSRSDMLKIIGPPVSTEDLAAALKKYQANPNITALIESAALILPVEEETVLVPEEEPDDLISTTYTGS